MSTLRHLGYFPLYGRFTRNGTSGVPSLITPRPCLMHMDEVDLDYIHEYPLLMTLEQAMSAYWKPRNYRIVGHLFMELAPGSFFDYEYDAVITGIYETPDMDFKKLVCGLQFWFDVFHDGGSMDMFEGFITGPPVTGSIINKPPIARDGEDGYRPQFSFFDNPGTAGWISSRPDGNPDVPIFTPVLSDAVIQFPDFPGVGCPIYMNEDWVAMWGTLNVVMEDLWEYS